MNVSFGDILFIVLVGAVTLGLTYLANRNNGGKK